MRRSFVVVAVFVAWSMVAIMATTFASSHPELDSITTADDYKSVSLTFSSSVYRLDSEGDEIGDEPLQASDFSVSGTSMDIATVTMDGSRTSWTIEFEDEVIPHLTTIEVVGDIGNDQDPVEGLPQPVPFSNDDVQALVGALTGLAGETIVPARNPAEGLGVNLPFVQDWLGEDHTFADLVDGFSTDLSGLPSTPTEAEVIALLEEHGITASFDEQDVTLALDSDVVVSSHNMGGAASVGEIPGGEAFDLALEGDVPVDISLGGEFLFTFSGGEFDFAIGNEDPAVHLRSDGAYAAEGRLGVVDVAVGADIDFDATLTVSELDPVELTATGDVTLDLTDVSVSGTGLNFLPEDSDPLLSLTWNDLSSLFACEDGSAPDEDNGVLVCWTEAPEPEEPEDDQVCADGAEPEDQGGVPSCQESPVDNVDVDLGEFDTSGLRNFTRVSVNDFLGGLNWFGAWLSEVEEHGLLGQEVPVIGEDLGELGRMAEALAVPVQALSEIAALASSDEDLSAQGLLDVCQMSTSELDDLIDQYADDLNITGEDVDELRADFHSAIDVCEELLDSMTITADAIEFDLSVSASFDPLNGDKPSLELGLGDDLSGMSLGASTGNWSSSAVTTFNLTVGIKLGSDSELGIEEDDHLLGNRFYVEADEISSLGMVIDGEDIGAGVRLGFLDATLDGSISLDPSVMVSLNDIGSSGDGTITLSELADSADNGSLGDLISLDVSGDIDAPFTLTNSVLPDGSWDLHINGPISALGNELLDPEEPVFAFESVTGAIDTSGFADDRITVAHNLGDALELKTITPAQAVQMIVGIAEQLGAMTGSEAMDLTIPFIDVRFQEAVSLAGDFADIAERVQQRNPQDISAMEAALNGALGEAGMPTGVSVGLTGEELTLTFDASKSVSRSYPFSFGTDDFEFAPADGGASINATADLNFSPEIGILFDGDDLEDRLFIRGAGPEFELFVDANVFGSVYLGPMSAGISGSARIGEESDPARLAVTLADGDASERVTLADLGNAITSENVSLFAVEYDGALFADLSGSTSAGSFSLSAEGDLSDLENLDVDADIDFEIALDLETLVYGSVETSRFAGRLLEQSETLSAELPFIGDELRTLAGVGTDMQVLADELEELWEEADDNASFVDDIEATLDGVLCPDSEDCIDVRLLDSDGEITTSLGDAEGIEIHITAERVHTEATLLDAGVDLAPVFELDLSLEPEMVVGYTMDLVIGLNTSDGFYIESGSDDHDDIFQLFAGFSLEDINGSATLLDILEANIEDGRAGIGGDLGPDENAGGFAIAVDGKLSLRDISNRRRDVDETINPRFEAQVTTYLPLSVEVEGMVSLSFPLNVLVNVENARPKTYMTLGCDPAALDGLGLPEDLCDEKETIILDASTMVDNVIEPVFKYLESPDDGGFNPLAYDAVSDTMNTQVPVLDERVRDIISAGADLSGQQQAWLLVEFLLDAKGLTLGDDFDGLVDFGWVVVVPEFEQIDPETPLEEQPELEPIFTLIDAIQDSLGGFGGGGGSSSSSGGGGGATTASSSGSGGQVVRFPIIEDPSSVVMLLLGGEHGGPVTFIEVNPDPIFIGPSINWDATLFDLDVGFIKGRLSVALLGNVGLGLDFGFGYDSTGLASGNLLDGFYLIDPDGYIVSVGGQIQASVDGKFSVLGDVASVRFRGSGGVRLQAGVGLFGDSPALPEETRNDGKLHFHEIKAIAEAYESPIASVPEMSFLCMFEIGILFDANLSFSGKAKVLGITVFSESYSDEWTFVDETLTCDIIEKAAHIENRVLLLNGGIHADQRFDGEGDVAENFTLVKDGNDVHVTVTTPQSNITTTFGLSEFDEIHAELGQGNDSVEIDEAITDKPATIRGGPGDDTLAGGGSDDTLIGGPGNDVLKGTAGDNHLRGGDGDDELWPGTGTDLLEGGGGINTYRIPQGWGDAEIDDAAGEAIIDFGTTSSLEGSASFFEATVINPGHSKLSYDLEQVKQVLAGEGGDTFTINRYAKDGFEFDARGGCDTINVPLSGVERSISVTDSDPNPDCETTLNITGTAAGDTFLLRADGPSLPEDQEDPIAAAETGFVALITPTDAVDRVNYDDSISLLKVNGNGGANHFAIDDVATELELNGGDGGNTFQVGQIFGLDNPPEDFIAGPEDMVRTRGVEERGPMSVGVSHPATIRGGNGDDRFTVYSNVAALKLEGISGDNVFVLRAFILEDSVEAAGGDGNDRFEYVPNENVNIDGGDGFNTLIVIGTELSDGFLVEEDGVKICRQYGSFDESAPLPSWSPVDRLPNPDDPNCGIDADFTNIQSLILHGLHGNNAFWVRSTSPEYFLRLFGGTDGATFLIGDHNEDTGVHGDLSGIKGPVEVDGEADPEFDAAIVEPVVLPGEDAGEIGPGLQVDYDNQDNRLVVDGRAETEAASGTITDDHIAGFNMGGDVTIPVGGGEEREFPGGASYLSIDFFTVLLGDGDHETTVENTHADATSLVRSGNGNDSFVIDATAGTTTIDAGLGDNNFTVHSTSGVTDIFAGDGDDQATVNNTGGTTALDLGDGANDVTVYGTFDTTTIDTGTGEDNAAIYSTGGDTTVDVGSGDDDITIHGTSGNTTVTAGAGNDAIVVHDADGTTTVNAGDGDDEALVHAISGQTSLHAGTGDNVVRVGSDVEMGGNHPDSASAVTGVADTLHVSGSTGEGDHTRLVLDGSGTDTDGEQINVEQAKVTGLGMPGEMTYVDIQLLEVYGTNGEDVTNVRGTSADLTILSSMNADDRFFVSDTAYVGVTDPTPAYLGGTLDDIAGDLDIQAGDGDNLLMVSDRDSDTPIVGGELAEAHINGFAGGDISYEASGTYIGGITTWTGSAADTISVVSTRSDGDPTTLDWGAGEVGGSEIRTLTTLNTGDGNDDVAVDLHDGDGLFVLNTQEGDDTVEGGTSTLGFIVFGGEGNDAITTGDGYDIVFGDQGRVEFCEMAADFSNIDNAHGGIAECSGSQMLTLLGDSDVANINDGLARRPARIYSIATLPGATDGLGYDGQGGALWNAGFNNRIHVRGGDDVAFGGRGNDLITAESGNNALAGDDGEVWRFIPSELGDAEDVPRTITTSGGFIDITVLFGEVAYVADISSDGGNDIVLGGAGDDWTFSGPGNDIVNSSQGDDIVWGDDGHDIIWGGEGDDRIYSGNGDSVVDLKQATWDGMDLAINESIDDGAWWDIAWHVAPDVDKGIGDVAHNGHDLVYGGRGRDVMQADVGAGGPVPGDRLADWYGPYNLFLVCDGAYGAGRVLRQPSPGMETAMLALALADGAYNVYDQSSSGGRMLALVTRDYASENRNPGHPNHPGNNAPCGDLLESADAGTADSGEEDGGEDSGTGNNGNGNGNGNGRGGRP